MLVRLISLLKHAGDRWFILTGGEPFYCAGGDIMQVFHLNRDSHIMFALAYQTVYNFSKHNKLVTIWSGISMGTGLGLSIWGKYRVATSTTMFAYPEQELGCVADVGSNYWASHFHDKAVGLFVLLTAHRLNGSDLYHLGIATHYIEIEDYDAVVEELKKGDPETALSKFHVEPDITIGSLVKFNEEIHRCFSNVSSVYEIIERCEESPMGQKILKKLQQHTLFALNIQFQAIQRAANMTFKESLLMEGGIDVFLSLKDNTAIEIFTKKMIHKQRGLVFWTKEYITKIPEDQIEKAFNQHPGFELEE